MEQGISVIMTCYNEEVQWLKKSINSILNQTYEKLELIVVLDNPNNTELKCFLDKINNNNKIKIIINKKNIGLANSLNIAFKECNFEFIARMDADDIAIKDRLERQMEYLIQNNLDIVGSNSYLVDEEENIIGWTKNPVNSVDVHKMLKYYNCLNHPTWLLRKQVFIVLNGYYPYNCAQDYDFLLRAKKVGFKIGNLPEPLLLYRVRTNSISAGKSLNQFLTANYIRKINHKYSNENYTINEVKNFNLDKNLNRKFYKHISIGNKYNSNLLKMIVELTIIFRNKYGFKYWININKKRLANVIRH